MTDQDPTRGADNSGERLSGASEAVARALGNVAHIRGMIDDLEVRRQETGSEIDRLRQQLEQAVEDRRQMSQEAHDFALQHRNAVRDTVQHLAGVLDDYDLSVAEGISLLQSTLAQLDPDVLNNVTGQPPLWDVDTLPAVRDYDSEALLRKDGALRDLPDGEFIGVRKGEEIWVGRPSGIPRLKLVEEDGYSAMLPPFPYVVGIEMELAESDNPERQEHAIAGDILVGADAIVNEALVGKRHDYRNSEGKPFPAELLLKTYRADQEGLQKITAYGLMDKISSEQKARVKRAVAQSHAGFRSGVAQQARTIYRVPENRARYAATVGEVYFDKQDYRKTTHLIDHLYGDGSSEAAVQLAAYTQVLARLFEEQGELRDDVEVSDLDMRQAMYYLTLDKSGK